MARRSNFPTERLWAGGGLIPLPRITPAPHTYGAIWRLTLAFGLILGIFTTALRWALSNGGCT
jgi:hypothetical protein